MDYSGYYRGYQTQEYARREPSFRPTGQLQPEYVTNDVRGTGKRILWTINLRPGQKMIDEEQGLPATAVNGKNHMDEHNKLKAPYEFIQRKVELLEIVQTRSIPEDEENETVILTDRDIKGDEKGNRVACETRWIHIRNNPMSFDEFQAVATEAPGLAKHEIGLLLRLLRRVRHSCEKNFVHGKYLLPVAYRYVGKKTNLEPEEKSRATFFSFPYFCLRPLNTSKHLGRHAPLYPSRALLQSHYRLESTGDRDKEQVVRKLGHWRNGEALHVSQLWCTLVDRNTIITNTDLDLSDLYGKNIRVEPYSATAPAQAGLSTVQYTDLEGQLYFFSIAQCKTWFELLQTIKPTVRGSPDEYELTAGDGQLVTEENWSKRVEQEESSRIHLTWTRKTVPIYSESEDTELEVGSLETAPYEAAPAMFSAHNLSGICEETVKAPSPDPSQDHIKEDFVSHTPYSRDSVGQRSESRIAGLAGGQPAIETDYPVVLNEQSSRKPDNSTFIQPLLLESPNGVESDEISSSSRATTFPPKLTQPSAAKGRPTVTFTARPHFHEPSTSGETHLPVKSDSDTTTPDIPQSANFEKRGSTEYLSAVGLDENSAYPGRSDGEHGYRSRSSRYSARRVLYEEDDEVPITRYSRRNRRRITSPDRPRLRRPNFTSGGPASARPDDIYYTPPTVEKSPETPSITVAAASVPPEHKSASAEHVEAQIEKGGNLLPEPSSDILRKGRRTPERRPSSPESAKPTVLPIFLWPIGQSSATNAGEIAHKDTSGDKTDAQHSVPGFRSFEVNDNALAKILDDADKRLKTSKKTNERKTYASIETKSLQEVDNTISRTLRKEHTETTWDRIPPMMHEVGTLVANIHRSKAFATTGREKRLLELKKDVLTSAKQLLHAFVPHNYQCPVIDKYWGAVYSVLQDRGRLLTTHYYDDSSDDDGFNQPAILCIQEIQEILSEFLDIVKHIQNGVSQGSVEVGPFRYQIPKALFEAFTRLVMVFVLYSSVSSAVDDRSASKFARVAMDSANQCKELLIKGRNQLIVMVHTDDDGERVSYEALEPEAILALVMENLMQSCFQAGEYEMDLAEVYSEYMSQLEIKVQSNPSVRQFRDIKYLGEELEIISKTLLSQRQVLLDYQILVNGWENTLRSYSSNLRRRILSRSLQSVDQKIEEINELRVRASNTQFLAAQTISVHTESKDKAILVFTVVTVIFLPLTFVTGYLGMNVQDVRNSTQDQGLFWSIALPITFVIFVAVLLLMAPSLRTRIFAVFPSRRDKDD